MAKNLESVRDTSGNLAHLTQYGFRAKFVGTGGHKVIGLYRPVAVVAALGAADSNRPGKVIGHDVAFGLIAPIATGKVATFVAVWKLRGDGYPLPTVADSKAAWQLSKVEHIGGQFWNGPDAVKVIATTNGATHAFTGLTLQGGTDGAKGVTLNYRLETQFGVPTGFLFAGGLEASVSRARMAYASPIVRKTRTAKPIGRTPQETADDDAAILGVAVEFSATLPGEESSDAYAKALEALEVMTHENGLEIAA